MTGAGHVFESASFAIRNQAVEFLFHHPIGMMFKTGAVKGVERMDLAT